MNAAAPDWPRRSLGGNTLAYDAGGTEYYIKARTRLPVFATIDCLHHWMTLAMSVGRATASSPVINFFMALPPICINAFTPNKALPL